MEHDQDPVGPPSGTTIDRFDGIVAALAAQDPRFVRRVTRTAPGGMGTGHLMVIAGLLVTVVLGVVPLALGLHAGSLALLVVGAVGSVALPVAVPLLVRPLARRRWPAAG